MPRSFNSSARAGAPRAPGGLAFGLSAYVVWGLFPIYIRSIHGIPGLEFVAWRLVLSLPVCVAMVLAMRQSGQVFRALRESRTLAALALSALLIGTNWIIFTVSVLHGHVLATSLGYYINPLINVLLGTVFLGERLSPRQWLAVALAAGGVALLASGALTMLGIALGLGLSFSGYGLVRKLAPVSALPGLTVETILLLPVGIAYLIFGTDGTAFSHGGGNSALLACAGLVTAVPLVLFAAAARRLDLSTLGFVQYISPTIGFFLGLFVFHEPLHPVQLASFALIWLGIGIFTWDLLARRAATA